jgi:hypothetical protein
MLVLTRPACHLHTEPAQSHVCKGSVRLAREELLVWKRRISHAARPTLEQQSQADNQADNLRLVRSERRRELNLAS